MTDFTVAAPPLPAYSGCLLLRLLLTAAVLRGPFASVRHAARGAAAQRERPSTTPAAARSTIVLVGFGVVCKTSKSARRSACSAARPPAI